MLLYTITCPIWTNLYYIKIFLCPWPLYSKVLVSLHFTTSCLKRLVIIIIIIQCMQLTFWITGWFLIIRIINPFAYILQNNSHVNSVVMQIVAVLVDMKLHHNPSLHQVFHPGQYPDHTMCHYQHRMVYCTVWTIQLTTLMM